MKKLIDYININNNLIEEQVLSHLAIEYKINDVGEGKKIINEKYGIYNGCEELADYIVDDIFNSKELDNQFVYHCDDLQEIKNIYFNKLIIDVDTSADCGGECDDNIHINKNLKIDEVFINIYLLKPTKSEVKGILMHELTHIYNNYIMQLKGNMNYIKTSGSYMYKNIIDTNCGVTEREIKQVLYFLLGYERNAFIAQLKSELDTHKNKIKNPLDALKILKQCKIYNAYIRTYNTIQYYINYSKENKESELIANIYKQIIGIENSNETTQKILKRLKAQSIKAIKKLNSIIPKLCVENLNNIKWRRELNLLNEYHE